MIKYHLITLILLILVFSRVSGFCQVATRGFADTIIFEGKLVDSLTDEMLEHMPDVESLWPSGISVRFLDVSSPDPKEVEIILFHPEGRDFYRPGDLYTISASKIHVHTIWHQLSHMADTTNIPLECVQIRHAATSPHILEDSGINKLAAFTGTWHAWNTDSADKGKLFADFTCHFSLDGQYLIADRVLTNSGAVTNMHSVYAYSKEKDNYSMTVIGIPDARPFAVPIAFKGDSLIYNSEVFDNGKRKYARRLDIFLSATSYIFLVQSSENGWYWYTDTEGKATKADLLEKAKP